MNKQKKPNIDTVSDMDTAFKLKMARKFLSYTTSERFKIDEIGEDDICNILSMNVNAALACEIYLKIGIYLKDGAYPKTHDLLALFHCLDKISQEIINKKWDNEEKYKYIANIVGSKNDSFSENEAHRISKQYQYDDININDLEDILRNVKDSFVGSRYLFSALEKTDGVSIIVGHNPLIFLCNCMDVIICNTLKKSGTR